MRCADALELVSHRELLAFSTLMAAELAETAFGPGAGSRPGGTWPTRS